MLSAGEKVYILADHTKFNRESLVKVADLSPEYTIITDSKIILEKKEVYNALIEKGVPVIIADN